MAIEYNMSNINKIQEDRKERLARLNTPRVNLEGNQTAQVIEKSKFPETKKEYPCNLNNEENEVCQIPFYPFFKNKKDILLWLAELSDSFKDIFFWKKLQVQPAMAKNVANSQV